MTTRENLHDPMHWQLTLVRSRVNRETGLPEYYSAKDTAANRNQGRFAKLDKPRDEFGMRGAGVVYEPIPYSRAKREAITLNACARDLAKATDVGSQRIVSGKRKRRA